MYVQGGHPSGSSKPSRALQVRRMASQPGKIRHQWASQSDAVSLGLDWPTKTRRGMGTSLPPYFPTSLLPCDLLRQSMSMAPATVRHRHTPRAAGSHHTHQDMNRVVTRMVSGQFAHHKMVTTKGTKHKRSALHHEAITHSLHTLPNQQRAS